MNNTIIKEALSYSLGSDLHEEWRKPRKLEDGTYEPRMKKSKDESWNLVHGTDDVDIANTSFSELPSNWQYENLEAAKVVINLVFDKIINNEIFNDEVMRRMASIVHDEWLKRNSWVYDPEYGDPKLAVSFDELSEEEKKKDIVQLEAAYSKVMDYVNGLIDIDSLCSQYNIENSDTKTK